MFFNKLSLTNYGFFLNSNIPELEILSIVNEVISAFPELAVKLSK